MPRFIEPQLAKLVERPPAGPGLGHEIKFDGYRMQLRVEGGKATLRTRKGLDWTANSQPIAEAGAQAAGLHHRRRGRAPSTTRRARLRRAAGGAVARARPTT